MKINEIAKYIIENYPDSNAALNLNGLVCDWEKEFFIDELMDFFNCNILGNCGCGCPELTSDAIRKVLLVQNCLHSDKSHDDFKKYKLEMLGENNEFNDGLIQFMMYQLDDKEILKHGSSIGGA